jgi:DHA1 family tetracycline resistance protein-like MFS transporter
MQAYVVRRTAPSLGEWRMVSIALISGAVGYAIYALAPNGMVFWMAIPIFSLVGYFSPGLQALMTRRVGPESQGQLQGVNSSIMGIAGMIGPAIFTTVFSWAVNTETTVGMLGAPFLVAAALHLVAIVVLLAVYPKTQHSGPEGPRST